MGGGGGINKVDVCRRGLVVEMVTLLKDHGLFNTKRLQ